MSGKFYEVEAKARVPSEGWEILDWRRKLREEQSKSILKKLKK